MGEEFTRGDNETDGAHSLCREKTTRDSTCVSVSVFRKMPLCWTEGRTV